MGEEAKEIKLKSSITPHEIEIRNQILNSLRNCPIPNQELLSNLGLFLDRRTLSRIIFFNNLYLKILSIHGVIIEFGVRWGQDLALFSLLRSIYEPYNYSRKIIGFDTFGGFPGCHEKDGQDEILQVGAYNVTPNYEDYLNDLLSFHESVDFYSHIKKYELIKGDVKDTFPKYLGDNPETMVACAYFDLDLFEPTKYCLSTISDYISKGSIIVFDELCCSWFPGETLALKETLGIKNYTFHRSPYTTWPTYMIIE